MAALCVASASPLVSDAGGERAYLAEIAECARKTPSWRMTSRRTHT
jgi:hypothetical protein